MNLQNLQDLLAATNKFVSVLAKEIEDGWDPTTDIPDLVVEAIKDFAPLIQALLGK